MRQTVRNNKTIKKAIKKRKNKIKTKKKFRKLNCSANKEKHFTCYSKNSLEKIKKMWNKRHPDKEIHTNDTREIWKQLKNNLKEVCSTERCWIKQKFMENNLDGEILNNTHAPYAPKSWKENPNEWLTSNDIEKVMKQYEVDYPNFIFIGPSPIDFDKKLMFGECVWNELCNLNIIKQLKDGKNKIGIIFNTDPHNKSGSHWISLFIDIKRRFIFYFDSNGDKVPREIMSLIERIEKQGTEINIDFTTYFNRKEHQYSNTECGMYSLYFLNQMITTNKSPREFNSKRIPDKDVEELRKIYFN